MFKIGPYTFSWRNPLQYLMLWSIVTLLLLIVAGFAPALAIMFAVGVLFATVLVLMRGY